MLSAGMSTILTLTWCQEKMGSEEDEESVKKPGDAAELEWQWVKTQRRITFLE